MKSLVAYYSRTGNTRSVAREIASLLSAEEEEIKDVKSRKGVLGFIGASFDALLSRLTQIAPLTRNAADFELIVVGTPVWAGKMAPAVRTFLEGLELRGKRVALFCTTGGSGSDSAIRGMMKLVGGAEFLGSLSLKAAELQSREKTHEKISKWVSANLKGST